MGWECEEAAEVLKVEKCSKEDQYRAMGLAAKTQKVATSKVSSHHMVLYSTTTVNPGSGERNEDGKEKTRKCDQIVTRKRGEEEEEQENGKFQASTASAHVGKERTESS
ncbi:hypothetical protein MLD38_008584 [Melastoma candidum]|uniref:Uncharacterized protein n=1 Tax=Melastoma candidum TaxID=119954 RepID=A0ACB9RUH5_9MYRT|nr:hypothetical protein MLD38_008584 [Melastoma candidum]